MVNMYLNEKIKNFTGFVQIMENLECHGIL